MFLKQYNYKPRSGSQSGASGTEASSNQQEAAPASNANQSAGVSAAIAGRRRSSATERYAGLHGYKRNSQETSRPDFSEQTAQQPGVLGQMWTNFTKGTGK